MNTIEEKNELLVLGNFVGRLLEEFPIVLRSTAVKDIEEAEERFCKESQDLLQPILGPELWKIEHDQKANRDPRLRRKKHVVSYGEAIENYLAAIPEELRGEILRQICSIISYHGTRFRKSY